MGDPLSLLREYIINKKEVIEHEGHIMFGELSWPKNVDTNYMVHGSGRNGNPIGYYTLECVLFLVKNVGFSHPSYIRRAAKMGNLFVRRPDRKQLLAYIYGDIITCSSIDKNAPFVYPTRVKLSPDEDDLNNSAKKHCLDDVYVKILKSEPEVNLHSVNIKKSSFEDAHAKFVERAYKSRFYAFKQEFEDHANGDIKKFE